MFRAIGGLDATHAHRATHNSNDALGHRSLHPDVLRQIHSAAAAAAFGILLLIGIFKSFAAVAKEPVLCRAGPGPSWCKLHIRTSF